MLPLLRAVAFSAAAFLFVIPAPAAADDGGPAVGGAVDLFDGQPRTPAGLTDPDRADNDDADMLPAERHRVLSAELVGFYAAESGRNLAEFTMENRRTLADGLGLADPDMFAAGSAAELAERLSVGGARLNLGSLEQAASDIFADDSAQHAVARQGALWSQQTAALRMPQLSAPSAAAPQIGEADVAFGAFLDRSVANFVGDFPDVFGEVSRSGLGTSQQRAAWNQSMVRAFNQSSGDLLSSMPDRCTAETLAVAASGDPRAADGSDCAAQGIYLHRQLHDALSSGGQGSLLPPADPAGLPGWAQGIGSPAPPAAAGGASDARSLLDGALPDVFSRLQPR